MNTENREIIARLLKLYPDVIENLGGEEAVNSDHILARIEIYIEKHKWFVNENIPFTITLEQAFFSWHENVFIPQWNEMVKTNIVNKLRNFSMYDVFKMVSDEYYYQNEKDPTTYYNKACYSVILRESKSFLARKSAQFKLALLK